MEVIQTNVLIIGAGVQGLQLANELQKQGVAVLLLTESFDGQSTHHHGHHHRGFLFPGTEESATLYESHDKYWKKFLEDNHVHVHYGECFAFSPEAFEGKVKGAYAKQNVPYEVLHSPNSEDSKLPAMCKGGLLEKNTVVRLQDAFVSPMGLFAALVKPVTDYIVQCHIDTIAVEKNKAGKFHVVHVKATTTTKGTKPVTFTVQAQKLVFACGVGFRGLLEQTLKIVTPVSDPKDAEVDLKSIIDSAVKSFSWKNPLMLTIRGPAKYLPPVSVGLLPQPGLLTGGESIKDFLANGGQEHKDDDDAVSFITATLRPPQGGDATVADCSKGPFGEQDVHDCMKCLLTLMPGFKENMDKCKYAMWTGYKGQSPNVPLPVAVTVTKDVGGLTDTVFVNPGVWSHVPEATKRVIAALGGDDGKELSERVAVDPKVLKEKISAVFTENHVPPLNDHHVVHLEYHSWTDFQKKYNITV